MSVLIAKMCIHDQHSPQKTHKLYFPDSHIYLPSKKHFNLLCILV